MPRGSIRAAAHSRMWVSWRRLTGMGCMAPSHEVAMRPPEVFVRELSPEEAARLKSVSKHAKYQSKPQRAMILLASSTGMSAPQIAAMARSDESHVRKVIHALNEAVAPVHEVVEAA